jgi:hypothetical protein
MFRLNLFRSAVVLMSAFLLAPASAPAQDTLSIVGTFKMNELSGTVGDDLADVFANGYDHWWKLTLNGVSYSHDYYFDPDVFTEEFRTRVHAASFTFEFFGPDAATLNEVVGRHLVQGGVPEGAGGGAVLELINGDDSTDEMYMTWTLRLYPSDPATGFYFVTSPFGWFTGAQFPADELGYPLVQPQRLSWADSMIWNKRDGTFVGYLASHNDFMDIGSDQLSLPPPPLKIAVADASALEGNRGATTVLMTATLNRASDQAVTVNYQTANGTATAGKDYVATSGALTFQPGETSKTIAVAINGDRQREPNETFFVRLSNAVGAAVGDSEGVATIMNDD